MTREEAIGQWIYPAIATMWNEKRCKEILEAIEQEPILDKIRAEIIKYESYCRLSVDEYPTCKQCTDNVFETIYHILDKYKAESEDKE